MFLTFIILILSKEINAQQVVADSLQNHYKKSLVVTHVASGAILFGTLYNVWYKGYNTGKFHFFNDNDEWMQMDKMGHAYFCNILTDIISEQYRWVGYNNKKAALIGFATSNLYFLGIETMDGFSDGWGFSSVDVLSNMAGSSISTIQQILWKESKFQLKYGYTPSPYAVYRPDLLGNNLLSKVIKDYNAQTQWIAFSPYAFKTQDKWWKALQLSIGVGANGMIAGDQRTQNQIGYGNVKRYRQYMASIDIDWTKIPVKNQRVKVFLKYLNVIKLPLPQLVYGNNNFAFQLLPKY